MHQPLTPPRSERITFSVPCEVLSILDEQLTLPGENRSAAIRRLIEDAAKQAQAREESEQFIRAYTEQPQTDEEFGYSDAVSLASLAAVPWKA